MKNTSSLTLSVSQLIKHSPSCFIQYIKPPYLLFLHHGFPIMPSTQNDLYLIVNLHASMKVFTHHGPAGAGVIYWVWVTAVGLCCGSSLNSF